MRFIYFFLPATVGLFASVDTVLALNEFMSSSATDAVETRPTVLQKGGAARTLRTSVKNHHEHDNVQPLKEERGVIQEAISNEWSMVHGILNDIKNDPIAKDYLDNLVKKDWNAYHIFHEIAADRQYLLSDDYYKAISELVRVYYIARYEKKYPGDAEGLQQHFLQFNSFYAGWPFYGRFLGSDISEEELLEQLKAHKFTEENAQQIYEDLVAVKKFYHKKLMK